MKSRATKTGVSMLLAITTALCAAVLLSAPASAASPVVAFDVMQQVNGVVYAANAYGDSGMKEIKDAASICVVGDQIYYFDDFGYYAPYGVSLYVSNLSGGGKKLLAEHTRGNACYLDGKIYYDGAASEEGKNGGVYCMDAKTGKTKRLVANGDLISIYDNTIYYRNTTKGGVYRCTLTGGGKKLFSSLKGYDYGAIADGKYFVNPDGGDGIFVLDLKSPARYDRVAYADEYSYFIVDAGYLYYVRGNALYRCKTTANNGSGEVKLCQVSAGAYGAYPVKVMGSTLYFIEDIDSDSENTLLYKVPVSGGLKTFTGKSWFTS